MPLSVRAAGQWRSADSLYVRVSGVWKRVVGMAVRTGSAWKTVPGFVPPFSASSPTQAAGYTGTYDAFRAQYVQTEAVAVTPAGGASPYTYAWTRVAGDTRVTATAPTMATTRFSAMIPANDEAQATFRWTATDAAGQTVSGSVDVVLSVFYYGGGF